MSAKPKRTFEYELVAELTGRGGTYGVAGFESGLARGARIGVSCGKNHGTTMGLSMTIGGGNMGQWMSLTADEARKLAAMLLTAAEVLRERADSESAKAKSQPAPKG